MTIIREADVESVAQRGNHEGQPQGLPLQARARQTPRLPVVLDLPGEQAQRLSTAPDGLVLRRSAYWLSLRGHDGTENRSSITVRIPEQNLFNVDNLHMLMEQSRKGSIP